MGVDSRTHVLGINLGVDPISSPASIVCNVSPNKIATPTTLGAVLQEQSSSVKTGEECKNGGKRGKDAYKVQFRYSSKTSTEELEEICRVYPLTLSLLL